MPQGNPAPASLVWKFENLKSSADTTIANNGSSNLLVDTHVAGDVLLGAGPVFVAAGVYSLDVSVNMDRLVPAPIVGDSWTLTVQLTAVGIGFIGDSVTEVVPNLPPSPQDFAQLHMGPFRVTASTGFTVAVFNQAGNSQRFTVQQLLVTRHPS